MATIHVPQMLYFWPYMVFFSIPLTMSSLLPAIAQFLPGPVKAFCEDHLIRKSRTVVPGFVSSTLFMLFGLAAVHYNTIVHPYTLADNRHYVFYTFRILNRHLAIKYLAVPLYFICAWMTVHPFGTELENEADVKRNRGKPRPTSRDVDRQPCQISFVMVWIVTTTLSVVTAPLVEPRYFIIPWIIWRLHVPNLPSRCSSGGSLKKIQYDLRLVLETIWLMIINTLVGYNFLYRGFSWPSEPGKIQRFLW